jgi:molecular chaperone GrpE
MKKKTMNNEENTSPPQNKQDTEQQPEDASSASGNWEAKAKEYLDGWQRSLADFSNYKKRVEKDQAQAHQNASASILKKFLDVTDDLDRALKRRPLEGEGAEWAAGIDLVTRKLQSLLEAEGIKPIPAEGTQFDPNLHEAVTHEDAEGFSEGQVIEVLKQGYMIGERVLRPALVRVAR